MSSEKAYSCDPNLSTPRYGFSDWYLGSFLTIRLNASGLRWAAHIYLSPAAVRVGIHLHVGSTAAARTSTCKTYGRNGPIWFRTVST